jgi:hypothetical protein
VTAGPSTALRSGRDDNFVARIKPRSQKRDLGHPLEVWKLQFIFERAKRSGRDLRFALA